ncbi:MAG: hydrogenase subunit MbhD domain-containing protein [Wenzhouxiangella sp.]
MSLAVDLLIAAALIGLAVQIVVGGVLFRAIVLFIVFGLTMALAWARLGAPDLAMAEAAIGAGLTGALMLVAYRRLLEINPDKPARTKHRRSVLALPVAILASALVAMIGLAAIGLEPVPGFAGRAVMDELEQTGLGNPITGVLLVFRNLDTLLEIAVLLAAFAAARAVTVPGASPLPVSHRSQSPLVGALLAIIVPMTVLVAAHLLRAGGHAPGGAFQAGAVLAASGVLLALTGKLVPSAETGPLLRLGLLAGLVGFSLVGLIVTGFGLPLLAMPGIWAIYAIETAMMLSIAVALVLLFTGSAGLHRGVD